MYMLCFVLINRALMNLSCVLVFFQNASHVKAGRGGGGWEGVDV